MKPTIFAIWGVPEGSITFRRCRMRNGICSHSGVKHERLEGQEGGRFRTSQAQVYPKELAADLARQLVRLVP